MISNGKPITLEMLSNPKGNLVLCNQPLIHAGKDLVTCKYTELFQHAVQRAANQIAAFLCYHSHMGLQKYCT